MSTHKIYTCSTPRSLHDALPMALQRNRHLTRIEAVSRSAMDMLFRPRTVALIGLSADMNKLAGAPLRNILKVGFPGRIYPVNPKYPEIGGLTCHSSLEALPEAPDVALI